MTPQAQFRRMGWFALLALLSGLYLMLHFKVQAVHSDVVRAERRIVALEQKKVLLATEFETRANQIQLAAWNQVDFGYTAPTAAQFLTGERQLAALGASALPGRPAPIQLAVAGVEPQAPDARPQAAAPPAPAAPDERTGRVLAVAEPRQVPRDVRLATATLPGGGAGIPLVALAGVAPRMTAVAAPRPLAPARAPLIDRRRRALVTAQLRVLLFGGAFVLLAAAALMRLAWLGVVQPAPRETSMAEALTPVRAELTDRNGVTLARAFPAYALWYNPRALEDGGSPLVKSPQAVATELAAIFPDLDADDLARRLASRKSGYLRRRVLPEDANKVLEIGELALELPRETDRHYPQGTLAAHVLGYVTDGQGYVGMEAALNDRLADPARRGEPVPLSIDARVQGALEDELGRGMRLVDAVGAAGIVLDVDTGEVLALASLPEFDPNHMDQEGQSRVFNKVTNQVYELGSTFKPLTAAVAIDAGVVSGDLSRRWQASAPVRIGGFAISDSHTIGASLNVAEMLIHSSNIVTAQIADEIGPAQLKQKMAELGFSERPFIELPARGHPIWDNGEWARIRAMTVGFGHGVAVTPLHLATAYAAMVNGGIWRPATLRRVEPGQAPRGRRVFQESTSHRMNQFMRMIALYGTGRNANVHAPGFRLGGKTGSAEKPGNGGYRRSSLVSTFAAAFPMDNPRYVIIAMIDEPKGTAASSYQRTAAWNAAPVVGRLVPRIGPLLGVYPDEGREVDFTGVRHLVKAAQE